MDGFPLPVQRVVTGVGLAVLGLILTGGGWLWAAFHQGGGTYFVFTGLFLWGGVQLARGLAGVPSYLAARNSGDPWRIAEHTPALFASMVSQGATHDDPEVRRQAYARMPALVGDKPSPALAAYFAQGLVDADEGVSATVYQSLLSVARKDRLRAIALLNGMLHCFHEHENLIEYVPGGRGTLNQFYAVSNNPTKYVEWINSGVLPDIGTP